MALVTVPFSVLFAGVVAGVGYLPSGALVVIPPLYLLGVLVLDIRSALTGRYQARPRYLVWWLLAAVPTGIWHVWFLLS